MIINRYDSSDYWVNIGTTINVVHEMSMCDVTGRLKTHQTLELIGATTGCLLGLLYLVSDSKEIIR